jgi:actin related protein 2/3 complex subunit 2
MLLLEYFNRIILETLQQRMEKDPNGEKKESVDVVLADFDGVKMHLWNPNPDQRNVITLSISWKCVAVLLKNGGTDDLKAVYGSMVQPSPEAGYDFTIKFDIDNLPGSKDKFPEAASLLKRHLLAAPFKKAFAAVEKGQAFPLLSVEYRDDEAIYIKGEPERVTVVFSIMFKDADDQVFAKIFLQEFADARRNMSNAPAVSFSSKEAPGEIKGVSGVKEGEGHGFVTFVLFANHIKNADKSINTIQTFRDYLHYHIKCSKAHLHARMRSKVEAFLMVLNRARPTDTAPKEKKTMTGKTFVKK